MRVFDIVSGEIVVDPSRLIIPEFKKLWQRDKAKDKHNAMHELAYITFLFDLSADNPYRGYTEYERDSVLKKDLFDNVNWEPDGLVEDAIAKFKKLMETTNTRVLLGAKKAAEELAKWLEENGILRLFRRSEEFIKKNFPEDLEWSKKVSENVDWDQRKFIQEYVFAVYVSGFRYSVVQKKMYDFQKVFYDWNLEEILKNEKEVKIEARKLINNRNKINSIIRGLKMLDELDFDSFKSKVMMSIDMLTMFPYVGKVIKFQLARNLGFDVAKPDKHIVRIAEKYNLDPIEMCEMISRATGYKVHTVDSILWRYAEQGMVNYE